MTFSQIRVLKSSSFLDAMFLQIQDISIFQEQKQIKLFCEKNNIGEMGESGRQFTRK